MPPSQQVVITLNKEAFEFYVEASPGVDGCVMKGVLSHLRALGFEPIPEDECPAEVTARGWTRIHFVPVEPVDDTPLLPKEACLV